MSSIYWQPIKEGSAVMLATPIDVCIHVPDEGFDEDYLTLADVELRVISGRARLVKGNGAACEILGWDFRRAVAWRPRHAH